MIELNLVPLEDLEPTDAPHGWRSTGHDPQFLLGFPGGRRSIPAGWLRLDFEIEYHQNTRRPRLYWDDGE